MSINPEIGKEICSICGGLCHGRGEKVRYSFIDSSKNEEIVDTCSRCTVDILEMFHNDHLGLVKFMLEQETTK